MLVIGALETIWRKCVRIMASECSDTDPLGEDGHLDAVVGSLLSEGEHLLLGVVEEGGGARPAAVVKVRYHADLAPDANINTFYIDDTNIITSTSYSPGSVKLYSKVPWEKQNVITASEIITPMELEMK